MTDEVKATYTELQTNQAKFNEQSELVKEAVDRLCARMQVLSDGDWIGKGAEAFYKEMDEEIIPTLRRLQHALKEGGELTENIARLFQDAEFEASEQFPKTYSAS